MIRDTVNRFRNSPQELAFWLANMSELLHFIKMDRDLSKHAQQAQVRKIRDIRMRLSHYYGAWWFLKMGNNTMNI